MLFYSIFKLRKKQTPHIKPLGNIIYWTVSTLKKQTRQLTLKETKALNKIRLSVDTRLKQGYRAHYFLFAFILGTIFVYFATWTKYDFPVFVFGTIAVLSFACVVFMPYEIYKDLRRARLKIKQLDNVLGTNSIDVTPITAKQIALAKEYEDEGDLYIIETDNSDILYLWDNDYNLKKNFPCLEFEIYDKDFYELIGRQINPLSEKFKPIVINAKAKWTYLKNVGGPGHLTIERTDFKKIVEQINNVA